MKTVLGAIGFDPGAPLFKRLNLPLKESMSSFRQTMS